MVRRRGSRLTAAQKAELWRRWRQGESLTAIGRALGRIPKMVHYVVAASGYAAGDHLPLGQGQGLACALPGHRGNAARPAGTGPTRSGTHAACEAPRRHTMPSAPAAGKCGIGAGRTSVSQSWKVTGHFFRLHLRPRCPGRWHNQRVLPSSSVVTLRPACT